MLQFMRSLFLQTTLVELECGDMWWCVLARLAKQTICIWPKMLASRGVVYLECVDRSITPCNTEAWFSFTMNCYLFHSKHIH